MAGIGRGRGNWQQDPQWHVPRASLVQSVYMDRYIRQGPQHPNEDMCIARSPGITEPAPPGVDHVNNLVWLNVQENLMLRHYANAETANPQMNYYLRIPAILHLRAPDHSEVTERQHLRTRLRPHWGEHVYLGSTFMLRATKTFLLTDVQQYQCPSGQNVSCIYPCYHPVNGHMMIGLYFRRQNAVQWVDRTFRRIPGIHNNPRVSDLTEDIIDTAIQGHADLAHLQDANNWPEGSIALYVCNGAKLLVMDGTDGHNRSLFQQGSLVVMQGYKILTIDINVRQGLDFTHRLWDQAFDDQTGAFPARYNTGMDQQEAQWDNEQNRTVSQFHRKVLFLGAVESQYNSACWTLFHYHDDNCQLRGSEGAMMEDVAPWNTGFKLIRAQHLFQRSYESCFGPTPVIPNVLTARWPFEAPTNQYIFRRILGLEGNRQLQFQSPANLPIPQAYENRRGLYHNHQQYGSDDNVRRQLNWSRLFSLESHDLHLMDQQHAGKHTYRMAPPPLYPPVWQKGEELKYSSKAIPLYIPSPKNGPFQAFGPMVGARCKDGQQYYQIVKKEVPEYQWVKYTQNYNLDDQNSYAKKRFGDDYCWYRKLLSAVTNTYVTIGTVQMYCLEKCIAPPRGFI